jgi:hypothetical protein
VAAVCVLSSAALFSVMTRAAAQALTPDMLAPMQGGFAPPELSPLRRTTATSNTRNVASNDGPATSLESPAASGASGTGYDSLNRTRKRPKPYPGTPKPAFVGPGNPTNPPPLVPPRVTPPVSPSFAGTADGQPPRRKLRIDDDPFGQVGNYVGGFLVKEAVEASGGYDSNPGRFQKPRGSSVYVIAPELQATSDWTRHAVSVDLRGTYTGYGNKFPANADDCSSSGCTGPLVSPAPVNLDRPDFTGKIDGRLDVARDTRITSELRLRLSTDNPGSPNIAAGLEKYPIYATFGGTVGVEQDFNRLQLQANGNIDRTSYQFSQLTDGTSASNDDRNFNQYGGQARLSYDWKPGLKPFVEVEGDQRVHDLNADFQGFQRDSVGGYVKAGSTFEFSQLLTGELSAGWALRNYQDPRLSQLSGLLTSASLVWTASGLTTVRLTATSSIDETTLANVSGSLSRDYSVQVDHAFRRWLLGTAKFGYGTTDYQGTRFDNRYYVEGDLIYKLTRTLAIKGSVRHDWLVSSAVGANSDETIVLLGVRVQR